MYQQSGFEVLLNYNTYVWMAQIFILGMVVGYMRDQLHFVRHEDEEEIGYLNGQIDDIADINDSNVRMKHTFETQIVNHKDSLGKIYSITSKLDQYEPEEVLFYAAQILEQLMDSNDIAIYSVANGDYARLFSFTSETAKKMGNSIHYSAMTEMYEELKDESGLSADGKCHLFGRRDTDHSDDLGNSVGENESCGGQPTACD